METATYVKICCPRCGGKDLNIIGDRDIGGSVVSGMGASAVGRNPGAKGDVMSTMLLGQAVAVTTGLYGLVVALILLFANPLYAKLH